MTAKQAPENSDFSSLSRTKFQGPSRNKFRGLSRPIHSMPDFVKDALVERGLMGAYRSRPPYQQNDYIGWINRAKRIDTKQKRLDQMLYELERGDLYMKMDYTPKKPRNDESLESDQA